MKKALIIVLVFLAGFVFTFGNASAQIAPFLDISGNYSYVDPDNDGIGLLTFSVLNPTWITYTNGDMGCAPWQCSNAGVNGGDAIISTDPWGGGASTSDLIFTGALTNISPGVFGSGTFSIVENGAIPESGSGTFFTASLDGLDTNSTWNGLSNIVSNGSAPSSRYVTELLENGNGGGNISFFGWTTKSGGSEDFIGSSSGAVGITVAAPEPISAVLFITGGATLAFRRYRNKRN